MATNASLENMDTIQKAAFVVSDLTTAGKLVPEQAKEFVQIAILASVLLSMITVTPMNNPQKEINKMRFNSRILGPGTSGRAVAQNQRTKPDLSKVTLSSVLAKGEVRVDDEVFEDNIERQKLSSTIMTEIGEACGRDMEDLSINGDTTNTTIPLYGLLDGFVKQQTSFLVPSGSVKLQKSILRDLFKALPREFRRYKKNLAFITSSDAEVDYIDSISNRIGQLADTALIQGDDSPKWSGIPVHGIPLWPNTLGPGNETVVSLTDPKNMTVGVQRDIRLEQYRDVSAGQTVFVVTLRMDAKFAHEPATAKATAVQN